MATRRNPFCSKRLMISPTSPRWTPSGLMAMKVRSQLAAMVLRDTNTPHLHPHLHPHTRVFTQLPVPRGGSRSAGSRQPHVHGGALPAPPGPTWRRARSRPSSPSPPQPPGLKRDDSPRPPCEAPGAGAAHPALPPASPAGGPGHRLPRRSLPLRSRRRKRRRRRAGGSSSPHGRPAALRGGPGGAGGSSAPPACCRQPLLAEGKPGRAAEGKPGSRRASRWPRCLSAWRPAREGGSCWGLAVAAGGTRPPPQLPSKPLKAPVPCSSCPRSPPTGVQTRARGCKLNAW